MLRSGAAGAALAALVLLAPTGEAAPHGGRVVRVERHNARGLGTPRRCEFQPGSPPTSGVCAGHAVEVGETVLIVSTREVVGELMITHVTPDSSCGGGAQWQIEGELAKPVSAAAQKEPLTGVIDGGLDPRRAHAVLVDASPSGRQTDDDIGAYDTDGDGQADLVFDHFMCDAQGQPSQSMAAQCFEAWALAGRDHEPRRLRLDVVPQC